MPRALEKTQPRIVNMHEAKTNLSKLVEAVENGENIVIARNGKPAIRLAKLEEQVDEKGWSDEMLAHFAEVLAKPLTELEPDFLVRAPYDAKSDRNPFDWLEPEKFSNP
jgi:prevent-host-death family protein